MSAPEPMTLEVTSCARCGEDHVGVTFTVFTNPVEIGEHTLTHWAPCPTNGEPIVMQVIEDDEQ